MSWTRIASALRGRFAITTCAALASAALLAACGDGDNGKAGGESEVGAQTGAAKSSAATAGEQAAQKVGAQVGLPSGVTVGLIGFSSASEAAMRLVHAGQTAIKDIGWTYEYCDPEADPAKAANCAQSMLNKDVDVIFSVAHEASALARQMKEAKKRDIPWFNYGGDVANRDAFAASYAPDDAEMARTINKYLLGEMERRGATTVAAEYNTAIGVLDTRWKVLQEDLKAHPDIKIVGKNETDLANPVESIGTAARTITTANRDLGAYWTSIDFGASLVAKTVKATLKGAKQPIVTGFYGTHTNLQNVRDGLISGLVEEGLEATAWVTVDQAAELLARKQTPSQDPFVDSTYKLDFMKPVLITKDENMPAAGKYPDPPADFVTFFKT
jgi:ABC-type sugar transport system substrate-binding protein